MRCEVWVLREVSARGGTVRWGETTSKTKYLLASSGNSSGGDRGPRLS